MSVMLLITILWMLLQNKSCSGEEVICSATTDVTVSLEHRQRFMGTDIYQSALIIENLYNGATACFDLKNSVDGTLHRFAVKIESLYATSSFEDQYEFGIPEAKAVCTCSCKEVINGGNCNEEVANFCMGHNSDDICVEITEQTSNTDDCLLDLGSQSAVSCCSVGIRQSSINSTYKAMRIRDQHQYNIKLLVYPDYRDDQVFYTQEFKLANSVALREQGLMFEKIIGTIENVEQIVSPSEWYIGKSKPYDKNVFESRRMLAGKNEWDISKADWAKFNPRTEKFELNSGVTDSDIKAAFFASVKNCGKSVIETSFTAVKEHEFISNLESLEKMHSAYVHQVTWKNDGLSHGSMKWDFRESVIKTNLQFIFEGKEEDYAVEKVSSHAVMGKFTAEVVVSEHGNRFLHINITDSKGTIEAFFYPYSDSTSNLITFTFDVTEEGAQSKYYRDTQLKCAVNQPPGKLCLRSSSRSSNEECISNVMCRETRIKEAEIPTYDLVTKTIESEGMSNLSSWLKYANPFEWFNGIDNVQEVIVLLLEVGGTIGGTFLVLKVLKTMGLLGKCCHYMWCCFLCPKTEKKVRERANTARDRASSSMSHARRKLRESISWKRRDRFEMTEEETQQVDRYMDRRSFRERLSTVAIAKRLRRMMSMKAKMRDGLIEGDVIANKNATMDEVIIEKHMSEREKDIVEKKVSFADDRV